MKVSTITYEEFVWYGEDLMERSTRVHEGWHWISNDSCQFQYLRRLVTHNHTRNAKKVSNDDGELQVNINVDDELSECDGDVEDIIEDFDQCTYLGPSKSENGNNNNDNNNSEQVNYCYDIIYSEQVNYCYDIIYSDSYNVPVLYFTAHYARTGRLLNLDAVWNGVENSTMKLFMKIGTQF